MKVLVVAMFFTLFTVSVVAQSKFDTSKVRVEPYFANQGEQEDYWAKQLFKNEYAPQAFERFRGLVSLVDKDSIKFDNTTLAVDIPQKAFRAIFEKGIVYPDIIKNYGYRQMNKKAPPVKSAGEAWNEGDSYTITNFDEVPFLSISPRVKRFKFWLFNKILHNPEVCFIELTNDTATANTGLSEFINNSRLTYFTHAWVVM